MLLQLNRLISIHHSARACTRRLLLVCAVVGLSLSALAAVAPAEPKVQVSSITGSSIQLDLELEGCVSEPTEWAGRQFMTVTLPGCGYTDAIGEPQLPVIRRIIEVPEGAQVTATTAAGPDSRSETSVARELLPSQQPVPKIPGALKNAPLDLNAAVYGLDQFLPATPVAVREAGYFAGRRLVMIEVMPVSYNPVQRKLAIVSHLTVTVQFTGGVKAASALSAREESMLASLVLNHAAAPQGKRSSKLLVIVHSSLASSLTSFIAHKQNLGLAVDVANTTTTGTTTTSIKTYIQGRYSNVATRPDALLLVGDIGLIPRFVGVSTDSPDSDIYYACMDAGDDWQPEFPVGRFCVNDATQLAAVTSKTMAYETSAPGTWMSRAVFMSSSDNWSITEGTHNYCIATYLDPRGYTSDKLYSHTYAATPAQVSAAFNDGRVFGIYSGHGAETYWADGPVFYQSDVNNLVNAGKYPFVCSFACLTGQYSQPECFAETWQRANNKGAVEVWASSVTSYWTEDDILQKRLFSAIYDESIPGIGDAIWRAKVRYLAHFGPISTTRRYFEMYNLFGDPTVTVAQPSLSVAAPSPLPPAFVNEPYSFSLTAVGGTRPYTWSMPAGSLPEGLSLNTSSGLIFGIPGTTGSASFTVRVTDNGSATAEATLQLPVLARLRVASATNLSALVNQPCSISLQASGGTGPYSWSFSAGGGYSEAPVATGWIGGGTARGWYADDQCWSLTLPWAFPFYGVNRNTVWICSNGFLDFGSSPNADYNNSDVALRSSARIAPLWDDLDTRGPGDDIYVTSTSSYVVVRWAAHTWSDGSPVNVEVVLFRDGSIKFNYGAAHSGLSPTIGLSMGDNSHYVFSTRNNAGAIPAGVSSQFTRTGVLPPGLTLSAAGVLSGTPTQTGTFPFSLRVQDSGLPIQTLDQPFSLCVCAGTPCITDFSRGGNGVSFRFGTETGPRYCVEYKNDLQLDTWQVLTNCTGNGIPAGILDPAATGVPKRFYRVRVW